MVRIILCMVNNNNIDNIIRCEHERERNFASEF
jgi:hypothetical protein